jgi:glycosyltransferase involved in cell wall biosynthesis
MMAVVDDVSASPITEPPQPLTVVIATRNRGIGAACTIASIIRTEPAEVAAGLELIVVDQSDDDTTECAVTPYLQLAHVRYLRTASRGLGMARNVGVAAARGEWIAFTDDDCTPGPDWLAGLRRGLDLDARVGVVFGNVLEGPHDRDVVFVPSYVRKGSFLARSLADKHHVEGIGACMALRKSAWSSLGGFDPLLGAGSRFHAAEELDFVIRALDAGYWVYETASAEVVHTGFRPNGQKSALAYAYCFGIGAVYLKHLKCGHWKVLVPLAQLAFRWALRQPVVQYGTPPDRWPRLRGALEGAVAGCRTPVDRAALLYRPRAEAGDC